MATLRELGRGATSRVELARLEDSHGEWPSGALVAVKRLLPEVRDDRRARRALVEEVEAASDARDPSLVRALFAGEDDDGPFAVLEYVSGNDLRTELEARRLFSELEVRAMGCEIAGALAALHRAGRVHGDLKPENVRLDDEGRAVLVDLGFARRADGDHGTETPGTLAYLAPEVARGGPPSPAADAFALGVLVFELLTGEHPFMGDIRGARTLADTGAADVEAYYARLFAGRLDPPSRHVPDVSPFMDRLVLETLSPAPGARPSADDLARHLHEGERSVFWHERVEQVRRGKPLLPPVPPLLPLVGRERELATLDTAYTVLSPETGPDGASGCAVWITGVAGAGKSRLLREFASRARTSQRPPLYLYARASKRREARPLGTLLTLLRRWLALPIGEQPTDRELAALARTLPPREADTLAAALGPSGGELTPYVSAALAQWLSALAAVRPLLVFVDDLHAAGDATLAALGLFARELDSREAMLVLGLRSDEPVARKKGHANLYSRLRDLAVRRRAVPLFELELGPIDEDAVRAAVEARFHPSEPRLLLARVLHERSLGNPALLAEILAGLATDDQIHPTSTSDGRWKSSISPDEIPFPESLERAIVERYARLDPEERGWLERLAVLGGSFDPDLVARAFGADPGASLARLVERGLLARVGGQFRFEGPALRETIYASIPREDRSRLHAGISDALEAETSGSNWDDVFQRAFHLRRAGRHRELVELLAPLLPDMPGLGQPERILRLARWSLDAIERAGDVGPEQRLEILETAADAANRLGRRRDEREFLDRMVALPLDLDSQPALAARVYLAHGRLAHGRGDLGLARGWLQNASELAELAGRDDLRCDALRRLAFSHALVGSLEEALAAADSAFALAPDARRRAFSALARAQVLVLQNDVEDALAALAIAQEELGDRDEHGLLGARAAIDMLRARVFRSTGRHARALGAASRAVRRARQAGDRRLEVEASARLGGLLIDLDRPDEAETHLRDALYLAREIEDRAGAVLAQTWLGILMWERDDQGARAAIEAAAELAEEIGHRRVVAVALALRARVFLAGGKATAALDDSARAMELLDRLGAELSDRIVIAGTHVRVLRAGGREREARTALRELKHAIREGYRAIEDGELRRSQRHYAGQLLEAVLSAEGPLYPPTSADP